MTRNNDHNIHPATEGQAFTSADRTRFVVGPKCTINSGHWYCITCKKGMNQLEKDCHIDTGKHVLTWMCAEHGPEVP